MPKPNNWSLGGFLSSAIDGGHTHFRVIAKKAPDDTVSFYIHRVGDEDGSNGDLRTWEFKVTDNTLEQLSADFKDPTKYTKEGFDYHSGTTRRVEQNERIMANNILALWGDDANNKQVESLSQQQLREIALEAFNLVASIQVRDIVAPNR